MVLRSPPKRPKDAVKPSRRGRDGTAAVEFAFVGLPFFFMIFAIIEVAVIFLLNSVLDNATRETGRLVRTGQASAASMTEQQFETRLCSRMTVFSVGCEERLSVDVRVIPQFSTTPPDPMADGETFDEGSLVYANGEPDQLVLVRVWYGHPLFTPFLEQGLSRLKDGTARLTATTAFRNEPR